MSTQNHEHDEATTAAPRPGAAPIPRVEDDETIPPRPEEEIADVARSAPDLDDHHVG